MEMEGYLSCESSAFDKGDVQMSRRLRVFITSLWLAGTRGVEAYADAVSPRTFSFETPYGS
jgi:hypothetical protein